MPFKAFTVPLDAAGTTYLVLDSNRINRVSVTKLDAGAEFRFRVGQMLTSTITRPGRLMFPRVANNPDTAEGLYVVNDAAQAGLAVELFVSYERASDPPNDGISYESAGV